MRRLLLLLLIPLTGCYSIVTVNLGGVNHQAATTGPPLSDQVMCAALMSPGAQVGEINVEALHACEQTAAKAKKGTK